MTCSFQAVCVSAHIMAYRRVRDVCFKPQLGILSSHATLTKKRIISDSRAVVWLQIVRIHCILLSYVRRKRRGKKERKKKNEIEIFTGDLLDCENN